MCDSLAEGGRRCPGHNRTASYALGRARALPVPELPWQPHHLGTQEVPAVDMTLAIVAARAAVRDAQMLGWDHPCPVWHGEQIPSPEAIRAEEAVRVAGRAAERRLDEIAAARVTAVIGEHGSPRAWLEARFAEAKAVRDDAAAAHARGDETAAAERIRHGLELVTRARAGLAEIAAARRDALAVVLAEQGVRTGEFRLPDGHPGVSLMVGEEGRAFPAAWIERSATAWPPLTVAPAPSRGSYSYSSGRLLVGADGNDVVRRSTATHELAHRMAATSPALQGLSVTHHHQRVVHDGVREPAIQLPGHPPLEVAEVDEYALAYAGKLYPASAGTPGVHDGAELLPVGLQALLHGDLGGLRGDDGLTQPDDRLRWWTLGCLLAVP